MISRVTMKFDNVGCTKGHIFQETYTWDPNCVKEASYVLRIAADGLLLDGKFYDPFSQKKQNWLQTLLTKVGFTIIAKANGTTQLYPN